MRLSTNTRPSNNWPMYGYEQPTRGERWQRVFCCYFWFVAWDCISLGWHVSVCLPNIEIHLPFGFIRIGWIMRYGDGLR